MSLLKVLKTTNNVKKDQLDLKDEDVLAKILNYQLFHNKNENAFYKYVLFLEVNSIKSEEDFIKGVENMDFLFETYNNLHPKIIIFGGELQIIGNPEIMKQIAGLTKFLKTDLSIYISKPWDLGSFIGKKTKLYSKVRELLIRADNNTAAVNFVLNNCLDNEEELDPEYADSIGQGTELIVPPSS